MAAKLTAYETPEVTKGDKYSYVIFVLELMLTNIRSTHNIFGYHANLHNYVSVAILGIAMEMVDLLMQLENNTSNKFACRSQML